MTPLLAWMLLASPAAAEEPTPRPTLELLSTWSHAAPGTELELGLHFTLPEGWHIYWTNPGDSGMPTEATFTGPEGTSFDSVRYPAPTRIESEGGIVNYAYEGATALLSTVSVPATQTDRFDVSASATWLICKDICVFQEGSATASIPVPKRPRQVKPTHADRLAGPRSRVPLPLGTPIAVKRVKQGDGWRLETVVEGKLPAEFFPSAELELLLDDHVWRWEDGALVVRLDGRFSVEHESVTAVVSMKQHGGTRWYALDVPVAAAAWADVPMLPRGD